MTDDLVCVADVAAEPVRWLWPGRIPLGKLTVLDGGRVLRHPGDLQWLERRRLQAADLFAQGKTKAEVAGELGVSGLT